MANCGTTDLAGRGDLKLNIMIDGEGHFKTFYGKQVGDQQAVDNKYNSEALKLGYNVMRVHYADVDNAGHFALGYGATTPKPISRPRDNACCDKPYLHI